MEPIIYKKETTAHWTSLGAEYIISKIFFIFFVFFGARVPFMEGLYPFGIAIFASCSKVFPSFTVILCILVSMFFLPDGTTTFIINFGSILFFSLFRQKFSIKTGVSTSLAASISFFISSLIPKLLERIYLYDFALLILACISIFAVTFILCNITAKTFFLSTDFTHSVKLYAIILLLLVSGINNSGLWGKFLSYAICCFFTISFSYKNGLAIGCVSGILAGIVCGFPFGDMAFYISLFSLSSLCAGIFSSYGKICSSLSYMIGALLVTFYASNTFFALSTLAAIVFPLIIFPFFPDKYIPVFSCSDTPSHTYDKFSNFASSVYDISEIYRKISTQNIADETSDNFFDNATMHMCGNCSMQKFCWKKNYTLTYCSFFVLLTLSEQKETLSYDDIPAHLMNLCKKRSELLKVFISSRQLYKLDRLWQLRMQEVRHSVSKQLFSISSSLKNITTDTSENFLSTAPPYKLSCSFSQKNKDSVCGDSISLFSIEHGKFAAILCDGMGSGQKAYKNSSITVSMAEKMLKNGFLPSDTLEIINSLLLLKSEETSFSTVDMAIFDLYSGNLTIYKSGAACSFIKSGSTLKRIDFDTLPSGTFSKADIFKSCHTIAEGDTLIMVSDGVISADSNKKLESILSSPSQNADMLLNRILKLSGEDIRDDISIIVINVYK